MCIRRVLLELNALAWPALNELYMCYYNFFPTFPPKNTAFLTFIFKSPKLSYVTDISISA